MGKSLSGRPGRHRMRLPFHRQVLGTFLCVLLYRLLSNVPLPFTNRDAVAAMVPGGSGMMNLLSGGALSRVSVAALGISPYVSASIMIQLLGAVLPVVSLLQRSGPVGQKKLRNATLGLSCVIAVVSGTMAASGYRRAGVLPVSFVTGLVVPVAVMTVCAVGLALLGGYIDEHLFGRGVSVLIMAGVLGTLPRNLGAAWSVVALRAGRTGTACLAAGILVFLLLAFWLVNCRIDLRLSYSGKPPGSGMELDAISVLPVVALPGGVMPVVFASYFLSVPQAVSGVLGYMPDGLRLLDIGSWFDPEAPVWTLGVLIYAFMVWAFGRLSQMMSVNATEVSENLRRGGCTVESVPAGPETEKYLSAYIRTMTDLGSLGLCFIAILPAALSAVTGVGAIGYAGTSVLVVVSVMQELLSEAAAELKASGYMKCLPLMEKGPRTGNPFALLEKARMER